MAAFTVSFLVPRQARAGIPQAAARVEQAPFVAGEVVVGLRADADDNHVSQRLSALGVSVERQADLHVHRLRLRPGVSMAAALAALRQRGDVLFAEPNHILTAVNTPNDPFFNGANVNGGFYQQYGPQRVQADLAWGLWTPRAPVIIAIVDTGVDGTHPDLTNKMLRDANGNIIGYDAINQVTSAAADGYGHGTHCAGIAAAQVNNGIGIAGIAGWDGAAGTSDTNYIKIMPVQALDSSGSGTDVSVANGITWAADNGAKVISMSLGGPDYSATLDSATQYAWGKGCVVVAAAGNTGTSSYSYPGADTDVISVAASDGNDKLASFSTYGSWVTVTAPGVAIASTLPTYATTAGWGTNYGILSGTSMATPHVAGEAALIMAENPYLKNSDVKSIIAGNVDPYTPYATGNTIAPNGGRINVYRALQSAIAMLPTATVIANSVKNYSKVQGQNNWYYGYYTTPAQPSSFTQMAYFIGWAWAESATQPPWTYVTSQYQHPRGKNEPGGLEHWSVRRYVSPKAGTLLLQGTLKKADVSNPRGTGIYGHIFHNGQEVYVQYIGPVDGVGVNYSVTVPGVAVGDTIDFVVAPNGFSGNDSTYFNATITLQP